MKTYDFKQVNVVFAGRIVTGFSDGDSISVEMAEDAWTHTVGADGEEARSKSNNGSGKVTLRLQQSSGLNKILSELHEADKADNGGVAPLMIADKSGVSLHATDEAYILKAPTAVYGKTLGEREWVLQCSNIKHCVGGN